MSDWNEHLESRLRVLWNEGLSTAEIGRRLGLSKNAVVGKAHRIGLFRKSPIIRSAEPKEPRPPRRKPEAQTLEALTSLTVLAAEPPKPIERRRRSGMSCQFPLNDRRPWRFCEEPTEGPSPYCLRHHRICYSRVPWWGSAA
jgi:GcrA cell cycle regulator